MPGVLQLIVVQRTLDGGVDNLEKRCGERLIILKRNITADGVQDGECHAIHNNEVGDKLVRTPSAKCLIISTMAEVREMRNCERRTEQSEQ